MQNPSASGLEGLVYRRIIGKHWSRQSRKIDPAAFLPQRPGESLSVFNAAIVSSPRYVLQAHINTTLEMLNRDDVDEEKKERIRRRLANGDLASAENLYRNNWRIARLPLSAFPPELFRVEPPEPDGHQNIIGEYEDFQTYSLQWVSIAEMLTEQETLQN